MDGVKLFVGICAGTLIVWLVLEGIGGFFQYGLNFSWWTVAAASLLFVLWTIVYTAFWGSSNE